MGVTGETAVDGAFHQENPHLTEAGSNTETVKAL
jgi:hypothetical protein